MTVMMIMDNDDNDLRVSSSCCSSLDPKCGSLRRLPDAGKHVLLELRAQGLAETDSGGGLA